MPVSPADPILVHLRNHIATVTINRPEKRNALTIAMWGRLRDIMRDLAGQSAAARVVILRGAGGKVFSAGADLSEFKPGDYDASQRYGAVFEEALSAITQHPAPVIAQLRGQALGGGCQLALACDLRIAADRAELGIPVARIGIGLPAETYDRLLHIVGLQKAREILYLGRRYSAEEAHAMGLVDWVTRHESLEAETLSLADEIARNAPLAVQTAKAALNASIKKLSWDRDANRDDLARLDDLARRCFHSEDAREGLAAFFGRRQPQFSGR